MLRIQTAVTLPQPFTLDELEEFAKEAKRIFDGTTVVNIELDDPVYLTVTSESTAVAKKARSKVVKPKVASPPSNGKRGRKPKYGVEHAKRARALLASGINITEVSRLMGITGAATVRNLLERHPDDGDTDDIEEHHSADPSFIEPNRSPTVIPKHVEKPNFSGGGSIQASQQRMEVRRQAPPSPKNGVTKGASMSVPRQGNTAVLEKFDLAGVQQETWQWLVANDTADGVGARDLAKDSGLTWGAADQRLLTLVSMNYAKKVGRGRYRAVMP